MTLLWCDGFEGYGTSNNAVPSPSNVLADKYDTILGETNFRMRNDAPAVRTDWSLRITYSPWDTYLKTPLGTANDTLIAGIAINSPLMTGWANTDEWGLFVFRNEAGNRCAQVVASHGTYYIKDATGSYIGGVRGMTEIGAFHYVEAKVYGHATNGTIEVHINGCPVFSATSVNTAGASGVATRVAIGWSDPPTSMDYARIEDFYICDGNGSVNNDFLGDVTVKTLWPSGDASVNMAQIGENYATHYQQVNGGDSLRTTDWVLDSASGAQDTFNMDDTPEAYEAIHGVVAWAYSKHTSGTGNYKLVVESNGDETKSANITATTDWAYDKLVVETDPDTSNAWTPGTVNAMTAGFEIQ